MRRFRNFSALFVLYLIAQCTASGHGLPLCTDVASGTQPAFDFIVVGAGPGGGPLAARLAESGYSGMLVAISTARWPSFFSHPFSSGGGCGTGRGNSGRHYSGIL
jgi:hypothetical protein